MGDVERGWSELQGDDVDRRSFIRLVQGGVVAAAGGAGERVWGDLVRVSRGGLDRGWERAAGELGEVYVAAYRTMKPGRLLPYVAEHLNRLEGRRGEVMGEAGARRLATATGQMAALAGELTMVTRRMGESGGYLALAGQAARAAEDKALEVQVEVLEGLRHSHLPVGRTVRSGEAIGHLEKAEAMVRYAGDLPLTRAWLYAKQAREYGAAGYVAGANRSMVRAREAQGRPADPRERGVFSEAGILGYMGGARALDGYEGSVMVSLGEGASVGLLEEVLEETEGPNGQGALHTELAAAYALNGEPELAVGHAHRALDMARSSGFDIRRERVRGMRERLELWKTLVEVRGLDARLSVAR